MKNVSESVLGYTLALATVVMSLALWAVLWQADIIAYQQVLIRDLWNAAGH